MVSAAMLLLKNTKEDSFEGSLKLFQDILTQNWKKVLLNQFHDVLPGSSIAMVYKDAQKLYNEVLVNIQKVVTDCLHLILVKSSTENVLVFNSFPWPVTKVLKLRKDMVPFIEGAMQYSLTGDVFAAACVPASGVHRLTFSSEPKVLLEHDELSGVYTLKNSFITVKISQFGEILSLVHNDNVNLDVFGGDKKGNGICLYSDIPLYWDAWDVMDYHLETGTILNCEEFADKMECIKIIENGSVVVRLVFTVKISNESHLYQVIEMNALDPFVTFDTSVDWHENRKMLKVKFDTTILTRSASYDIQFGFTERPTHFNTSWDAAKFEVCGHKWADLSESSYGFTILNDCKYGWSAHSGTLSLSLLRSPKAPDEECDMKRHHFRYAAMPHLGNVQKFYIYQRSYEFNCPPEVHYDYLNLPEECSFSWVEVVGQGVLLDTLKLAENGEGIIARLFETSGGTHAIRLKFWKKFGIQKAFLCSGFEEILSPLEITSNIDANYIFISLIVIPFQIVSVYLVP